VKEEGEGLKSIEMERGIWDCIDCLSRSAWSVIPGF